MGQELSDKRICVLLSGGVDSGVVTHLLTERGLRPDLYYIRIGMDDGQFACTAEEDIEMCRATAHRYGLPLEVVDLQQEYWDNVVSYTIERVRRGLTPNPDVMCNRLIKFGAFEQKVGHAYDYIATGHYASIIEDGIGAPSEEFATGRWLGTAVDPVKDQTDFLAQIDQLQLSKLLLPLGRLPKNEVRRIALEAHLPSARRKDSQGICFLGKINYNDFVKRFLGEREGDVIDIETGKRIGSHRGYWFHTIGQRKGLGLGGGPWFVVRKDIAQNVLYVSHGYDTLLQYGRTFHLRDFHFIGSAMPAPWGIEPTPIAFKIRHTDRFAEGTITSVGDDTYLVHSQTDIQGIAPGQFGVIYDKSCTVCIGSGEIGVADAAEQ
ncbi:MAG: tRNA 2-thiouridine(34) synthase MnmA [Bacteroidaceae bacterium]|nr:tRNA 2-thiouridine(34) synthase MnmA [Bacteroidaceae bacterium]